ncbi:MAG: purine-nucleoside phosphorylase [Bacillota bacterium]|nr:purine-nucleoside phosphorylase [Bacillota bacterium]
MQRVREAAAYIANKTALRPQVGLILGSGLGGLAEEIEDATILPYGDIPHFPQSTVPGHKGRLVIGRLAGAPVVAMQGRFHYYEGYSMEQVVRPVRVMAQLGVKTLIVTNAAGGVNESFSPGDLMLIVDHINLFGTNPLIGPNEEAFGPRFPDMTEAYDKRLRALALQAAEELGIRLQQGVYMGLSGPTYETPAEIRAFRVLGADAVGMSTVPEVIAARHLGLRVLGISCVTNMAAGILPEPLSHEDVVRVSAEVGPKFSALIKAILAKLQQENA